MPLLRVNAKAGDAELLKRRERTEVPVSRRSLWWLLTHVGAVTFVVVKALKIVLVVLLSHALCAPRV